MATENPRIVVKEYTAVKPKENPEEPKCSKCVDPVKRSQEYKNWFSRNALRGIATFAGVITLFVWIVVTLLAFGIKEGDQYKAIVIGSCFAVGAFVVTMLWYVRSWFVANLYVGYEKETGRCHVHHKPFPRFLEKRADQSNGEQVIEKVEWLGPYVFKFPSGGLFRRPRELTRYGDEFQPKSDGYWSLLPGSFGLDNVLVGNPHGDVAAIPLQSIIANAHVKGNQLLPFFSQTPTTSAASCFQMFEDFILTKAELAEEQGARTTLFKQNLEAIWQRDRLGSVLCQAIKQLAASKGERKSRPAELTREWLEAQLNECPSELIEKWRAQSEIRSGPLSEQEI